MSQFGKRLGRAHVKLTPIDYEMYQLGDPTPVLQVLPAGEANKDLMNAVQKRNAKGRRQVRLSDAQLQARARKNARELFPRHVIKGWVDVLNDDGEEVAFTPEACEDFLGALPEWILDDLILFVGSPTNFTESGAIDPDDVEETAGN